MAKLLSNLQPRMQAYHGPTKAHLTSPPLDPPFLLRELSELALLQGWWSQGWWLLGEKLQTKMLPMLVAAALHSFQFFPGQSKQAIQTGGDPLLLVSEVCCNRIRSKATTSTPPALSLAVLGVGILC